MNREERERVHGWGCSPISRSMLERMSRRVVPCQRLHPAARAAAARHLPQRRQRPARGSPCHPGGGRSAARSTRTAVTSPVSACGRSGRARRTPAPTAARCSRSRRQPVTRPRRRHPGPSHETGRPARGHPARADAEAARRNVLDFMKARGIAQPRLPDQAGHPAVRPARHRQDPHHPLSCEQPDGTTTLIITAEQVGLLPHI